MTIRILKVKWSKVIWHSSWFKKGDVYVIEIDHSCSCTKVQTLNAHALHEQNLVSKTDVPVLANNCFLLLAAAKAMYLLLSILWKISSVWLCNVRMKIADLLFVFLFSKNGFLWCVISRLHCQERTVHLTIVTLLSVIALCLLMNGWIKAISLPAWRNMDHLFHF